MAFDLDSFEKSRVICEDDSAVSFACASVNFQKPIVGEILKIKFSIFINLFRNYFLIVFSIYAVLL